MNTTFHVARGTASDLGKIVQTDVFTPEQLADEYRKSHALSVDFSKDDLQAARDARAAANKQVKMPGATREQIAAAKKAHAAAEARVDKLKRAPWMSFGKYTNGRRNRKSIEQVHCFVGDADQPGTTRARLIAALDRLGCAYIVHTSTSHGCEGQERFRVIIFLKEPIKPEQYPALWAFFNDALEGMLDPGAKDPTRLSYMPRQPKGSGGHTVICEDKKPWFDASCVPAIDEAPQFEQPREQEHTEVASELSEEQYADVISALMHLAEQKASGTYERWSEIMLSLIKHGVQGYNLACKYSEAVPNYTPGCVEEFCERNKTSDIIADFRHVLSLASDSGWINPAHQRRAESVEFGIDGDEAGADQVKPAKAKVAGLQYNGNGKPLSNVHNAACILAEQTSLTIHYEEFTGKVLVGWPGEKERELRDEDITRAQIILQKRGLLSVSSTAVYDALLYVARKHPVHAVKDYWKANPWDGKRRLTKVAEKAFGTEPSRYNQRALRNLFISMVARVIEPGCQVDTAVVLEGPQGSLKSSALRIIGGKWYSELIADPRSKDFELQLQGVLLGEFSELSVLNKGDIAKIKQFITNRSDRLRVPYGKTTNEYPRQTVLCGTTNEDQWLNDPTGGRRFIPIVVGKIDLNWLRDNRDQLFAEAVALYEAGRTWWFYPREETLAMQQARQPADPWGEKIKKYLQGRNEITDMSEFLYHALDVPVNQQTTVLLARAGKSLKRFGCTQQPQRREDSKRVRPWIIPKEFASLPVICHGPVTFDVGEGSNMDLISDIPRTVPQEVRSVH